MAFTNFNLSSQNTYDDFNSTRTTGSTFVLETTTPVVDGTQGVFNDVPTMAAITTGAYLKNIDLFIRNDTSTDTDIKLQIYEGTTPANKADLPPPIAETEVITIPGSVDYTPFNFKFITKENTPFYTVGTNYYFFVFTPSGADPTIEDLRIGADLSSASASTQKVGYRFDTGGITFSPTYDITMRLNYSQTSGFAADPKITTLNNMTYHLPVDNNCYCIYDSMNPVDRLIINMKCHIRKTGQSYGRYVYIYYNGEEIVVRLPNLMVGIVSDKLNQQVEEDNVPRNPNQRYMSSAIEEIGRTSTTRKLKLKTNSYGNFHLCFNKNKFGFNLNGPLDNLNTAKSIGCVKGTKMRIPNITFKALM